MENTRFPGFNEKQVQWLEDKTAHLDGFMKTQAQQELYRKMLPHAQGLKFQEQRQDAKNEMFYRIQDMKDPVQKKRSEVQLRMEDLADFAKQRHGLKPQLNTKQVFEGVMKESHAKGIDMKLLENYLNNGDEEFLYTIGFKERPEAQEQGGLKGMLSRAGGNRGHAEWLNIGGRAMEIIDDWVQKIPTVNFDGREEELRKRIDEVGETERQNFEEKFNSNRTLQVLYGNVDNYIKESKKTFMDQLLGIGDKGPNFAKQMLNVPGSFLKTATGIGRALTNPLDTVMGLKNVLGTEEGRQAVLNRYGKDFMKTLEEDPIGLASDVLSLVGMGGGVVAKGAKLAGLESTAGKLGKFAAIADGVGNLGLDVAKAKGLGALKEAGAKGGLLAKGAVKTIEITQEPLKVAGELLKAVKDGKISEIGAELITRTVGDQDKLYKAQEPRMNVLNKKKDLKSYREQSDLANMLIVEAGHKPTDTTTRLHAHKSTMESKWKEIESKVKNKADLMVDQEPLADVLDNFIKEKEKLGIVDYQSDLEALRKQSQALRNQGLIDLPTLETKKQGINGLINNWGESKMGDVYKNGLKELTHAIGEIENKALSSIPDEFSDLKKEFGALKATYEDVFKADMKNQRAKGIGLVESYSKIEGLTEMLGGAFSIFTRGGDGVKDVLKGAGKALFGSAYGKAKNVDFLIKKGFEGLSKEDVSPLIKKYFEEARNRNQKNLPQGKEPTSIDLTDSTLSDEQRNAVIDESIVNSQRNANNSYIKKGSVAENELNGPTDHLNESIQKINGNANTKKEVVDAREKSSTASTTSKAIGGKEPTTIALDSDVRRNEPETNTAIDEHSITKNIQKSNNSYLKSDGSIIEYKKNGAMSPTDFKKRQFSNKHQLPLAENMKGKTHLLEAIKLGELEKGSLGQVPAEAFHDGKVRPLELSSERYAKIFQKHGPFSHENLIATANDWDYLIKDLNGKEGHINLIKELPDGSALLIGAERQNGAFILTHFEPTKSLSNILEDAKKNGGEVIEKGLDKLREGAKTRYPITQESILSNRKIYEGAKQELDSFLDQLAETSQGKALKTSLKFLNSDGSVKHSGIQRIIEKANKKSGNLNEVTDIARGSVIVDSKDKIVNILEQLQSLPIKKLDDKFSNPTSLGYKDVSFLYPTSQGVLAETQINIPGMIIAKEGKAAVEMGVVSQKVYDQIVQQAGVEGGLGHKYYEEWRTLEEFYKKASKQQQSVIEKKMKQIEAESRAYYAKFE